MKFSEAITVLDTSQRREDRWVQGIDAVDKLASGIAFYEGN